MWRTCSILFLCACGSSSSIDGGVDGNGLDGNANDAPVAESGTDAADAGSDAPVDGAATEAGCVITVTGALAAAMPCSARVLPSDATHERFRLVSTFSNPTSAFIDCNEPKPIQAGSYSSPVTNGIGCQVSIADYFSDGGVNHEWDSTIQGSSASVNLSAVGAFDGGLAPVQGTATGTLHQGLPVNGMAGPVMFQAAF